LESKGREKRKREKKKKKGRRKWVPTHSTGSMFVGQVHDERGKKREK